MNSKTVLSIVERITRFDLLVLLLMMTFLVDNLGAQNWELVHNLPGYEIYDVAVSPNGDIFVAVDTDGVLRSQDDGATWQPKNAGLDITSSYCLAVDSDGRLFAASEDSVYRSLDSGETWTVVHAFFRVSWQPSYAEYGTDIRCTKHGTILASYWNHKPLTIGDFYSGGSIWSNESGDTFSESTCENPDGPRCSGPTHTIADGFGSVVFRGGNEERYTGEGSPETLEGSMISCSFDGGLTWTDRSEGLGAGPVTAIAVAYTGPIVAGIWDGALYRSTDLGDSWILTEGIPSATAITGMVSRLEELYAATPQNVYRSLDGGLNWVEFSDGIPADAVLSGLEIDYQGTIWAMTNQGLYRTACTGLDSDGDGYVDCIDRCAGSDDTLDEDLDGVPDGCDNCLATFNFLQEDINGNDVGDVCEGCCGFWAEGYTGNTNCDEDGMMTLSDITRLIDFVFISKDPLCCERNGNTNGSEDEKITLSDITRLIDNVFISKEPTEWCL